MLLMAVRVAPQHELLEQKEREKTDQNNQHHVMDAAIFQRVRQELEEHGTQKCTHGERDEPRNPRRRKVQRRSGGERRQHAAGKRRNDNR